MTSEGLVPVGDTVHAFWSDTSGRLWHWVLHDGQVLAEEVLGKCWSPPRASVSQGDTLSVAAPGFGAALFVGGGVKAFPVDLVEGFDVYGGRLIFVRNHTFLQYRFEEIGARLETLRVSDYSSGQCYMDWDSVYPPGVFCKLDTVEAFCYYKSYFAFWCGTYKEFWYYETPPCWLGEGFLGPRREAIVSTDGERWLFFTSEQRDCYELPTYPLSADVHPPYYAYSLAGSPYVFVSELDTAPRPPLAALYIGGTPRLISFAWTPDSTFWVLGEVDGEVRLVWGRREEKQEGKPPEPKLLVLPGENAVRFVSKEWAGPVRYRIFSSDGRLISQGFFKLERNFEERVRVMQGGVYVVEVDGLGRFKIPLP